MTLYSRIFLSVYLVHLAIAVKVKVVMHSEEDSKIEEEEVSRKETLDTKKKGALREETVMPFLKKSHTHVVEEKKGALREETVMPFLKKSHTHVVEEKNVEYEEDKQTTEKPRQMHPNEMIFPLIYRQTHINSMFKFGENWYTWSIEKRTDGSKATNYYICYEEPKHCDDVGWDRTDSLPKCAFQIESLMPEDRACVNSFGVEPHTGGVCDGAEQMKVVDVVHACGPRIRSLWRFLRVGRRPVNAAKPADVNSLICEDEEECYLTIEYRIHHDRITFSIHEPTRGQTFKSALKRDLTRDDINKVTTVTPESHPRLLHRNKKVKEEEPNPRSKKTHVRSKAKTIEGKGVIKERNDSAYGNRRLLKNKIKIREDVSDDISE